MVHDNAWYLAEFQIVIEIVSIRTLLAICSYTYQFLASYMNRFVFEYDINFCAYICM